MTTAPISAPPTRWATRLVLVALIAVGVGAWRLWPFGQSEQPMTVHVEGYSNGQLVTTAVGALLDPREGLVLVPYTDDFDVDGFQIVLSSPTDDEADSVGAAAHVRSRGDGYAIVAIVGVEDSSPLANVLESAVAFEIGQPDPDGSIVVHVGAVAEPIDVAAGAVMVPPSTAVTSAGLIIDDRAIVGLVTSGCRTPSGDIRFEQHDIETNALESVPDSTSRLVGPVPWFASPQAHVPASCGSDSTPTRPTIEPPVVPDASGLVETVSDVLRSNFVVDVSVVGADGVLTLEGFYASPVRHLEALRLIEELAGPIEVHDMTLAYPKPKDEEFEALDLAAEALLQALLDFPIDFEGNENAAVSDDSALDHLAGVLLLLPTHLDFGINAYGNSEQQAMERASVVADELVKRGVPASRVWAEPVTGGSLVIDLLSSTTPLYVVVTMAISDGLPVDDEQPDRGPTDDDRDRGSDLEYSPEPATGVLVRGHVGERVRRVQKALVAEGFLAENDADGQFGPRTHGAVSQFQAAAGLETDGRVGPMTHEALGLPYP